MNYKLDKTVSGSPGVALDGRFTHKDYIAFQAVTADMESRQGGRYVFDLSRVEFMDSAAIGMLLVALGVARRQHLDVVLRGAQGQPGKLLETGRMHELFTIEG